MNHYTDRDLEQMYDEMLNDCYEEVNICGMTYEPADCLRHMDPTAYRCGLADYLDSLVKDEVVFEHVDGELYDEPERDFDFDKYDNQED